jgi:hypothetical protein
VPKSSERKLYPSGSNLLQQLGSAFLIECDVLGNFKLQSLRRETGLPQHFLNALEQTAIVQLNWD